MNGCYDLLFSLHFSTLADADFLSTVRWIWDTFVLLKIVLFEWKLLQDIHPTRIELWRRGITRDVRIGKSFVCKLQKNSTNL